MLAILIHFGTYTNVLYIEGVLLEESVIQFYDNLLSNLYNIKIITAKNAGPKVSVIQRFHLNLNNLCKKIDIFE